MKEIIALHGETIQVDDEDYKMLSRYRWYLSEGYAYTRDISMARMIMDPSAGLVVDHIDHNKLNNKRSNLRICTQKQNNQNRPQKYKNITGYRGVSSANRNGWFHARISHKFIGSFPTAEEAARAYDEKAKEKYGEFAVLNFPR
jgi:hypothetical protein